MLTNTTISQSVSENVLFVMCDLSTMRFIKKELVHLILSFRFINIYIYIYIYINLLNGER